ncbi:MAG: sterol desaturase family protein [Myxococcales bacterium]|nr:sterol desaturase family protein [Myxococcales bacterium]
MSIDWPLLGICLGGAIAAGLVMYHGVAAYYHLRYYVGRRDDPQSWKIQPTRFLSPKLRRSAVWMGSGNLALGGFVTGLLIYAIAKGHLQTPIFFQVSDYGWIYTIATTLGYFVVVDGLNYYVHRLFHTKFLFRHFHRHHHKFTTTNPYTATALHPVELLAQQTASFLPAFIVPLHAVSIGIVLSYILIFNVIDHSGVRLSSSLPWQGPSTYHDDHHVYFHCNFGQHLMIFDKIHGTLRRKDRRYGAEVFGGKGEPNSEHATTRDEFVEYR